MTQVVVVRPWHDARTGGGCCSGHLHAGITRDPGGTSGPPAVACRDTGDLVGQTYRRLRTERPDVDVQVVDAGNVLWLVPTVFRAVRRVSGTAAALHAAAVANRAGVVLVDGVAVGQLEDMGAQGVVAAVDAVRRRPGRLRPASGTAAHERPLGTRGSR